MSNYKIINTPASQDDPRWKDDPDLVYRKGMEIHIDDKWFPISSYAVMGERINSVNISVEYRFPVPDVVQTTPFPPPIEEFTKDGYCYFTAPSNEDHPAWGDSSLLTYREGMQFWFAPQSKWAPCFNESDSISKANVGTKFRFPIAVPELDEDSDLVRYALVPQGKEITPGEFLVASNQSSSDPLMLVAEALTRCLQQLPGSTVEELNNKVNGFIESAIQADMRMGKNLDKMVKTQTVLMQTVHNQQQMILELLQSQQ